MDKSGQSAWQLGRKPRQDDFEDLDPFESEDGSFDDGDDSEDGDESEEVDFDNPRFKRTDMWNDYAEDLDFEE